MSGATKNLTYAYVERGNQRSKDMSTRFRLEPTRSFTTMVFSRFFPKKQSNVLHASQEDQPAVIKMLHEQYFDHTCYTDENIDLQNGYYLLKKGDEIIAGAMFHTSAWNIVNFPGLPGWIMVNILSKIPILKRIFSTNYKFLAVEGIVVKPGSDAEIPKLLEGVCHQLGYNIAMLALDNNSDFSQSLSSQSNWGILRKLSKSIPVDVLFRFNEFTEQEKLLYHKLPAYISTNDIV